MVRSKPMLTGAFFIKRATLLSVAVAQVLFSAGSVQNSTSHMPKAYQLEREDVIRISIVSSYDPDHICGGPQLHGFMSALREFDRLSLGKKRVKTFSFDIRTYFMFGKTRNLTQYSLKVVADDIMKEVGLFKPKILVTIDDIAFRHVGIPHLKSGGFVLFSGINRSLAEYEKEYGVDTFSRAAGVEERISLDALPKVFSSANFAPSAIYMIQKGTDPTITGVELASVYDGEFSRLFNGVPVHKIYVDTVHQLRSVLLSLNDNRPGVIVPIVQRLWGNGGYVDKDGILPVLRQHNRTHIELASNSIMVRSGMAISVGPDFFAMGGEVSRMMIRYFFTGVFTHTAKEPEQRTAINLRRVTQIGATRLINSTFDDVFSGD